MAIIIATDMTSPYLFCKSESWLIDDVKNCKFFVTAAHYGINSEVRQALTPSTYIGLL
jgi:hypothetical protein